MTKILKLIPLYSDSASKDRACADDRSDGGLEYGFKGALEMFIEV